MSTALHTDRYGNALTTTSAGAARDYSEGIDRALAGNPGAEQLLGAAIGADGNFALPHIALARLLQFRGDMAGTMAAVERAGALAPATTPREQAHVEIMTRAIRGDANGALAATYAHVRDYPRDAFILSQSSGVYGLIGFGGCLERNDRQLELLESVEAEYGDDWWFLGSLAFAHEECENYVRARELSERSLALFERNGHAAHIMAHVFFETGDPKNGSGFLDDWIEGYEREAQLYTHLHWHRALFVLAGGDFERALAIYRRDIRPGVSQAAALGIIADAASLLWRCDLYGYAGELPWGEVRDFAAEKFRRPGSMFADVHCALAYAAAADEASLGTLIDGLRKRAAEGRIAGGEVVPALAEGVAAFAAGDYEGAIAILEPMAPAVVRIGGSHAQREVFEDTLLEAYLRAGRSEAARHALETRLARRPSARDLDWLTRASA